MSDPQVTSKLPALLSLRCVFGAVIEICEVLGQTRPCSSKYNFKLPLPRLASCSSNTSFPTPVGLIPFNLAFNLLMLDGPPSLLLPFTLPFLDLLLFTLPFRDSPPFECTLACLFRSLTLFFDANIKGIGDRSSASQTAENAP